MLRYTHMICGCCSIHNYSHDQINHHITTLSYSDREREGREGGGKEDRGSTFFLGWHKCQECAITLISCHSKIYVECLITSQKREVEAAGVVGVC